MGIEERAMLVILSISIWTNRRVDKEAGRQVAEWAKAREEAGKYVKYLVDRDSWHRIVEVANSARSYHYFHTLPWLDGGRRILPVEMFEEYSRQMRKYKERFYAEVDRFVSEFPALVADARAMLGKLFNPADYPDPDELRGRFSFEVTIEPVPTPDFRVQIAEEELRELERQVEERLKKAEEVALRECWNRLYEVVHHMVMRLSDSGTFRDSLVGNIRKLCGILTKLNLTGDPQLEEMRREIEEKLVKDPNVLRKNKRIRRRTLREAERILNKIKGVLA